MGALADGIKEIFATAKTTGTNVMICTNNGTPDGHVTMSNLATVLGMDNKIDYRVSYESTLTDLKTATKTGWTFLPTAVTQNVTDKPSGFGSGSAFLGVLGGRGAQDLIQVFIKQSDDSIWIRGMWNNNIIVDWKRLAFVTT